MPNQTVPLRIVCTGIVILCLTATGCTVGGPSEKKLHQFLVDLQDTDPQIREAAVAEAGPMSYKAVEPLADLIAGGDRTVNASSAEALANVAKYAARPETLGPDRRAVADELAKLLKEDRPATVKRVVLDVIWHVANRRIIEPIAAQLAYEDVRDHALTALERIGGRKVIEVLEHEYATAPDDFKPKIDVVLARLR
jgi:hypothetical protein